MSPIPRGLKPECSQAASETLAEKPANEAKEKTGKTKAWV